LNFEATLALAEAVDIPVIASGGLSSMQDIERLAEPRASSLEGAIVGRALHDGRIDARRALAMLRGNEAPVPGA
ncbi:MAG: 1-(5-phosphoribosyl)-5-((5-phosphoribosylamino)methylideneamino)imidazole-4-carboxamide isomerase, partial [Hyphomicrobiales bacterium]|nr:1-(5-phosphoribosyl)-5-((5-phosphoribosylamino)methylideneamino)imidazole-4-carboxamide isomerase [Hyphomicrobiales bacterium]